MHTQPPVFSGTLRARTCRLFWSKTPVLLTYHRQDYRQALPVLLIRRSNILGGEIRIPLDLCIHPVSLLPVSKRMASRLEFTLMYGWHTKQIWFRAPDARSYQQWMSLMRAALESGRKPLARYDYTMMDKQHQVGSECSSVVSTVNTHSTGNSKSIRQKVVEEIQDVQHYLHHDFRRRPKAPSEFLCVKDRVKYHPETRSAQDAFLFRSCLHNCSRRKLQL